MKVLGLDTSHYVNTIGITENHRVLADLTCEARWDSLVKIIANVDAALKCAGMKLADMDGFGVGLGPGSWTGIRVGVTVAKMLAYATGKPVCGVPTLEAMAAEAVATHLLICPIISAGTKEAVYSAPYRVEDGTVRRVGEYYVGGLAGLAARLKEPAVVVAEAADFYSEGLVNAGLAAADAKIMKTRPRGTTIARLAAARLEHGEKDDALALTPLYLKESTAQVFQGNT